LYNYNIIIWGSYESLGLNFLLIKYLNVWKISIILKSQDIKINDSLQNKNFGYRSV